MRQRVTRSRAVDAEERKKYLRTFEKRLYDEEVHYIHTFNKLDTVWLSE